MTVNGIFDRLYGCRGLLEERILHPNEGTEENHEILDLDGLSGDRD
jgi:hypothetical protein